MNLSKKSLRKLFIFLFSLTTVFLLIWPMVNVKGGEISPGEAVNLHIKAEASTDGTNWYNYSGTDYSGNQTLSANPGDTIQVRIKVWNDGDAPATGVVGTASVINSSYISSNSIINDDSDGNSTSYSGSFFSGNGQGTLSSVGTGTEGTSETGIFSLTLSNSIPDGETVLLGEITISDYGLVVKNPFWGVARAEGLGNKSAIRVAVNVSQSTEITSSTEEELPQTGGQIPPELIFWGASAIIITAPLLYKIRKKK